MIPSRERLEEMSKSELRKLILDTNEKVSDSLTSILAANCSEAAEIVREFCDDTGFEVPKKEVSFIVTITTYNEDIDETVDVNELEECIQQTLSDYTNAEPQNIGVEVEEHKVVQEDE